jgi:hypothetical protein
MRIKVLGILLSLLMVFGVAGTALAATTADVTITFTPTYIAMTNDTATWSIGVVAASGTYWWTNAGTAPADPFVDGDMKAILTNTGSVAEDFDIHTHNSTGGAGMTLSTDDTPAANEFSLRAGITGMANEAAMKQVITTETELISNMAAAAHMHWCMELETGTFTLGDAQSTTATITARVVS